MEEKKYHPAIRFIEVGRGRGVTRVPVVAYGSVGRSTMLHVIELGGDYAHTLCGKREPTEVYPDADPKAVRIGGANVCYRCRVSLGEIPMPHLKSDADPNTGYERI